MDDMSFLEMFMSVFFYIALIIGWFMAVYHSLDIDTDYSWTAKIFKFLILTFLATIPIAIIFWVAYTGQTQQTW